MEELRSTDILDKEIQNDAIKKSKEIIAAGQAEADRILADVDSRLEKAKSEKLKFYEAKEARFKNDLDVSVPLEKQRFLVSYVTTSINEALNDYFKKLTPKSRLEIALTPLASFKSSLPKGKKLCANVYGFDLREAKSRIEMLLGQRLSSCRTIDVSSSGEEPIEGIDLREGIILEAEDKSVKFRLTLGEAIGKLKDRYSKELSAALFGGRL